MSNRYLVLPFILSLGLTALLEGRLSAEAQTTPSISPPSQEPTQEPKIPRNFKLYYSRQVDNFKELLKSLLPELQVENGLVEDEIILYGTEQQIKVGHQAIAAIDLPRPGVNMQMWGIQISSKNSDELADVMAEVSEEISRTQQLVKETYSLIQAYAATEIKDRDFEQNFHKLLVKNDMGLGYESALSSNRPLSLIDIILRLVAAETTGTHLTQDMANEFTKEIFNDDRYKYYLEQFRGHDELKEAEQDESNKEQQELSRLPFERFFSFRGLEPNNSNQSAASNPSEKKCAGENKQSARNDHDFWKEKCIGDNTESAADKYAEVSRKAVLDFALQYAHFISEPDKFDPYAFQQSTDVLNNRLQDTVNALNRDIEDLFVRSTLNKIQEIVSDYDDVEYAQVGRTTVASLSGMTTNIVSESSSVFDRTPPLSLSELLGNVTELSPQTPTSLPISTVINLLTAYEKQQRINQTVKTGVTLNITPNVLRNMSSAELAIDLTLADPVASGTQAEGVPELSRIGQQTVKTTIYTDPVDFFAFSTFSNQSTLDGGRSYVPVVGTVWRGVFGSVPVLGDLFSWKNPPQDVLHESLLLTNTFIAPTALGLGLLYPIENDTPKFCELQEQIQKYPEIIDPTNADLVEKCEKNHDT